MSKPNEGNTELVQELLLALRVAIRERDEAVRSRRFWFRRWHFAVTGESFEDMLADGSLDDLT